MPAGRLSSADVLIVVRRSHNNAVGGPQQRHSLRPTALVARTAADVQGKAPTQLCPCIERPRVFSIALSVYRVRGEEKRENREAIEGFHLIDELQDHDRAQGRLQHVKSMQLTKINVTSIILLVLFSRPPTSSSTVSFLRINCPSHSSPISPLYKKTAALK